MPEWRYYVKVKHLFTREEDAESVRASMQSIHDVLSKEGCFTAFSRLPKFLTIPDGDDVIGPLEYANRLISDMYDYADAKRIWIE